MVPILEIEKPETQKAKVIAPRYHHLTQVCLSPKTLPVLSSGPRFWHQGPVIL